MFMMGYGPEDFHNIQDAQPDENGLIELPLVPLRDLVIYPNMVTPLFIAREASLKAIQTAQATGKTVLGVAQRDPNVPDPRPEDLYRVGTELALGRMMRMPDDSTSVLAQGRRRVEIVEFTRARPFIYARARIVDVDETAMPISRQVEAHMRAVRAIFDKCVELNDNIPEEAYIYALNIDLPGWLADTIAATLDLSLHDRQAILEATDPSERLRRVGVLLGRELDVLKLEDEIQAQVQREVDRGQRELFLREQMRVIQSELGEIDIFQQELDGLREQIAQAQMPLEITEKAHRELDRLVMIPPMAPEVGIIRTYLDWLIGLPWQQKTEDNLDISHAEQVLNNQHYGLEKAKERILEHIAVRQLAADKMKSPILCFVGPPGTGKTSLGRSIADALGREFVRLSLGGVRDEAEIRGHRRTYIGALPGRIIQTMRRAGTVNPVFMLDEIDKLGMDFRGDPAAALLEVLDPEQNHGFSDHYLDVSYDLSKVMFITTANYLSPVPEALLDRLEVIEFPGYTEEEKLTIARQFLLPRQFEAHGLDHSGLRFEDSAILVIIREYTYEAGVRNLEREIANICRKIARRVAEGKSYRRRIRENQVSEFLGPPQYSRTHIEDEDEIGLATGVAWTEAGGDIMLVEVALMPGKGDLSLTGQLGDVMRESAQAALSYARANADALNIPHEKFEENDIHVHIPEGAIPKDGPSAGITMVVALISALTDRPIRREVVMTGEITLRGRVLPIGGVKEKVLAAHRLGLRTVILPARNEKDLAELSRPVLRKMDLVFVNHMDEVLDLVLLPPETADTAPAAADAAGTGEVSGQSKADILDHTLLNKDDQAEHD